MFEYLMPMLVMPSYENTLLDETMRGAVERQMRYGRQRGVPWGISESGYNATDAQLNYQYRAFGVPGLGLKRGLAEDLVVAPYATVMALMVDPKAAVLNLQRLADEGLAGTFGYHEAIDYTPSRLPRGEKSAVVRSYMAHHQGMSLLALAYLLLDRPMQRRFESDPALQATLLLLQERVPRAVPFHPEMAERVDFRSGQPSTETPLRVITTPDTASPEVQLLSNGRYHVMLTNSGAGYSRWKDVAVTRWREDGTTDAWGSFCYLRDTETGTFWSTTPQPTQWRPDNFEAMFSEGRAEFRRRDQGIDAYTEIVVSPEDDIELRRLRLTNRGRTRRTIELTSYAEVVIAPAAADAAHPAFSKLFVQTEVLEQPPLILATRRPRSAEERPPWMFHLVAVHGAAGGPASHETDRARFIGRGRGLHAPAAMRDAAPLSGTSGSVLDPVAATRRVITLEPEQTAIVDIVYGVADTREACLALAHKMMDRRLADRVFELAWTHSQVILRQLNASEADAQIYARLASTVVYSQPTLRADAAMLLRNRRSQSGLWGYAISGDLPIVLLQISDAGNIDLVRQMVQAHAWWRLKGLAVDLVIWNEERDIYRQRLHEQILGLISSSIEAHVVDRPGGIFVRHAEQIAERGPRAAAGGGAGDRQRPPRHAGAAGGGEAGGRAPAAAARDHARRRAPARGGATARGHERADALQRHRRLHARRARVRDRHRRRASTAGALGQRDRQPALRHRRVGGRQRLHLVRERPRAAAHAVAQRPGVRHRRRGDLPARRGQRPVLVADLAAGPGDRATCTTTGRAAVPHPPRLRLQRVRARRGGHAQRADGLRGARRRGQVLAAGAAQRQPARAPPLGHRLRRMGAGRSAREDRAAHAHRDRLRQRRAVRPQPLQQRLRRLGRLLRRRPRRPRRSARSPATATSSSAATARCGARPRCGAPAVGPHRRRARPVRRDPGADRAGAGADARDRLSPRHGPQRRRGRPAGAALSRQRRRAGDARRGALRTGSTRSARCR